MATSKNSPKNGKVTNIVEGNASNSIQSGDAKPSGTVTNIVRGDMTNSIQCGDYRGGIRLGDS